MHWDVLINIVCTVVLGLGCAFYAIRANENYGKQTGFSLVRQIRSDFDAVVDFAKERLARMNGWRYTRELKRLDRLRERLRDRIEELARLEEAMAALNPDATIEQLMYYMNKLGAKHWEGLLLRLFLDSNDDLGLIVWLRRHTDRDVMKNYWYFAPQFADIANITKDLHHRLASQQNLWRKRRDSLRRDCMQHQVVIEEFEASLGIKPKVEEPTKDKYAKLKKVRVDITELRLEEERIEKALLDEENAGAPGPHRRKARITTDTD